MGKSVNKVTLLGNVGNEPEMRTTGSGTKVANFSVATNEVWYDKSNVKQERTEWHRCTAWDKVAEIVEQYVHKGDRIYVEGRISYSQTEDDKGVVKYWTDIVVRDLTLLGAPVGRSDGPAVGQPHTKKQVKRAAPAGRKAANPFDDDEDQPLPF